ncbi:MAG: hypothetical protein IIU90_03685 [Bacteroidaceae bacterium]|nr:hypothetical protein [Bacteroidaceae bacterium]
MREPTVPNIYGLTIPIIRQLRVDRSKITGEPFWRNNVINAWCLSGSTAKCAADDEFCATDEYWLGVYDEDAKFYAGKIRVNFSAYGGICSYVFKEFYNPKDIENELDLRIQEQFLRVMNDLIERGVFMMPAKESEEENAPQ